MKKINKSSRLLVGFGAALTALMINSTILEAPKAEAFSLGKVGDVVKTVKQQNDAKKSLDHYENAGRNELFEVIKKEDGVNTDSGYNQTLDRIMKKLTTGIAVSDPSINAKPYNYFINPDEGFNAYCTLGHNISINTGVFYFFDNYEDGIAAVVAHEMAHGQKSHPINGAKKKMTVDLVSAIAATSINSNGIIAADVISKQVKTVGVTRNNEKEADAVAFVYMADSGYNIGAPAAVWQRVMEHSGTEKSKGMLEDVLNPSTHPESDSRRDGYAALMTKYSNNKVAVDVKSSEVKVNGKVFMKPAGTKSMSGAQRSYLVAGNLARVYHAGAAGAARNDNGTVKVGNQAIVTPVAGDPSADELVKAFNSIK